MLIQPDPPVQLEAFLADVCLPAPQPDATALYLLLDHSGARGLLSELQRRPSLYWRSLFDGSIDDSAIDAAPLLVRLDHGGESVGERELLRWLHTRCATTSSVVALRTACAEDTLFAALQRRLNVVLPQGMPVMLRYFDTRTLSALPAVLHETQRQAFFGIATHWYWLDRYGHAQRYSSLQTPEADMWPEEFEFTPAQEAALIDTGAADAVVFHLVHSAPDVVRQHGRLPLHLLAQRCLPDMHGYQIDSVPMQALFCLAEIEYGPCFHDTERWKIQMDKVKAGTLPFAQAVSELGT